MNAQECIKTLLLKECMTITTLAEKMTEKSGKRISRSGLSNKLRANTLRFDELMLICDILRYDINFSKKL